MHFSESRIKVGRLAEMLNPFLPGVTGQFQIALSQLGLQIDVGRVLGDFRLQETDSFIDRPLAAPLRELNKLHVEPGEFQAMAFSTGLPDGAESIQGLVDGPGPQGGQACIERVRLVSGVDQRGFVHAVADFVRDRRKHRLVSTG